MAPPLRKEPGSQWLIKQNGKLWPCVVYPEDKLPLTFLEIRNLIILVPVLFIAKYKFCWCYPDELQEYPQNYVEDLTDSFDGIRSSAEVLRKLAFDEASLWHPLQYFEDMIAAKQAARHEMEARRAETASRCKHDSLVGFGMDGVGQHAVVKKEKSSPPPQIKREPGSSVSRMPLKRSSIVIDLCSDEEALEPRSSKTIKREHRTKIKADPEAPVTPKGKQPGLAARGLRRLDLDHEGEVVRRLDNGTRKNITLTSNVGNVIVRKNEGLSTPPSVTIGSASRPVGIKLEGGGDEISILDSYSRATSLGFAHGTPRSIKNEGDLKSPSGVKVLQTRAKVVKIYVGEGDREQTFISDMHTISKHQYFRRHLATEPVTGTPCVRSRQLADMTLHDFDPIGQFLTNGDYSPFLELGPPPYLKGIKSVHHYEQAALTAGGVWNHAKVLQLSPLMDLINRKIEAQWPLANDSLLMFTRLVYFSEDSGTEAERTMKSRLNKEISARFFELMHTDAMLLSGLMREYTDVCTEIAKDLFNDPKSAGRMNLEDEEID